jgi:5-methylcytosine-specific restriction endonuclease McrA|tara:strand:+ start:1752 stop:2288 length:537 start_codon:yes stop_codon:yes gene_type:complete
MSDTLVLNANGKPLSYHPLSAVHWHISIKLIFLNKVRILEEYSDWVVHSPTSELVMPSVVILKQYMNFMPVPKFNRYNVHLRDLFSCQYCGCGVHYNEATLDHVKPRSKGGDTSWLNVVTACQTCNTDKGSKIIKPLRSAYKPHIKELENKRRRFPIVLKDVIWNRYLDWPEELVNIA